MSYIQTRQLLRTHIINSYNQSIIRKDPNQPALAHFFINIVYNVRRLVQ